MGSIFSKIIEWGIILLVFLLPIFSFPQTTDIFEFPKQIFLFFFVSLLTFLWIVKMVLGKKAQILHSPLTLPIFIFLGIFFISTIFSVHRFSSFFGSYPRLHGGLIPLISYLLTFFLVSANIREKRQISRIFLSLSLSGLILVILGIFHFFNFYLPGDFFRGNFITPAGSADRTSLFLALILPILLFNFFFGEEKRRLIFSGILGFLFIFYITLISSFPALLSVFLIFLIALLVSKLKFSRALALRMGILFLIFLFLLLINNVGFVRLRIPFLKERPIQHDISFNHNTAWLITTRAFQDLKFLTLGSGPGTYLFDFTAFKPATFNQSPFWDLRLEKSSNEYFQITSTTGILGLLSFLLILFGAFRLGREFLKKGLEETKENLPGIAIFSLLLLFFFSSFFTPTFTLSAFLFWLFLAMALVLVLPLGIFQVRESELSLTLRKPETQGEILPWLLLLSFLLVFVPLSWQVGKIFAAELNFTKAQLELTKDQPQGGVILDSLRRAVQIMPRNDGYRRSLSATSLDFAILGQRQGGLSQEALQNFLAVAKVEADVAATLGPHNIFNWENRQRVYTALEFQGRDDILINQIFPQEFLLDFANPRHRNDLGLVYLNFRNDTELAKRAFQDAIELKRDFPDAHYNLARVYRLEKKKDLALQEYNQALNFITQQITSLEQIPSLRQDMQIALGQLRQFQVQIENEKGEVEQETQQEVEETKEEEVKEEETEGTE